MKSSRTHAHWIYLMAMSITLLACSHKTEDVQLEVLSPERSGVFFSNRLYEDENLNIITFEYFYNGAGVGIGDINNDGLQDIFFAANMSSNKLYLNKGNLTFEDITSKAGLTTTDKWAAGVAMVDINQDGWLDIYVCNAGPFASPERRSNALYINNGDNTFTEKASAYGLDDTGHSVQAAFFDYDRDGDLDVYILTNTTDETGPNIIRPKRLNGEMINTDRLYRNNGNGTFSNVSKDAGITIEGYGLGISICDLNQDGWADIYVSNDYLSNDILYINNHDGTFTDRAAQYFNHTSYSAMGNDASDYNNDGLLDIISVDMLPQDNARQKLMFGSTNYDRYRSEIQYGYAPQFMRNTLQWNRGLDATGNPSFSEVSQLAGVHATDWSWSPLFADIDNDGWKDLLITNGYPRDITNRDFANYKAQEFIHEGYNESVKGKLFNALKKLDGAHLPNYVFRNNKDLTFTDMSAVWGFDMPSYSTGAAYGDLDNDGDLDYVTNNINEPASVFENHQERFNNHYLNIKLEGAPGNRDGYGTKVVLFSGKDSIQYIEHSPYRGYQSSVDQRLHFGLGKVSRIDSLYISWPDNRHQKLTNVTVDKMLTLKWYESTPSTLPEFISAEGHKQLFTPSEKKFGILCKHQETEYADFKIERLLPHKYSQNGPGLSVGDINGDGLDDFFAGGAYKQSGQFFIQQKDQSFRSFPLTAPPKLEEDMGSLLFDVDGDNDNDLYVVSGGDEFEAGSNYYQDRLYLNDGHGNFKYNQEALPKMTASGSCVIAADYDADGDLDLFIGGRLLPHQYPQAGRSYLLQNNGGRFKDVTEQVAPGLSNIGMITAALWTDTDNDGRTDLMLVGEWMPVTIFKNDGKNLHKLSDPVPHSTGWWNSIQAADFDEDGDVDYVLGNLGLNTRYKTSVENPVRVYIDDFDNNGMREAILSQYVQSVNRPVHPRDDLLQQIPSMKKKFPDYQSYSVATMDNVLGGFEKKFTVMESVTFHSSYLENKGARGWLLTPLPIEAQIAPAFGLVADDYTGDGHADVIMTGNSFATEVLTGRYDAFKGQLLSGDGKGNFKPVAVTESNLFIDGDGKGLAQMFTLENDLVVLVTQNNDSLKVYQKIHNREEVISPLPLDAYLMITLADGGRSKHEIYYGSGYLSQSSRKFIVPRGAKKVEATNSRGERRTIYER